MKQSIAGFVPAAFVAASAIFPTAAASGEARIQLEAPLAAASLHEGRVDMVVFYLEHDDHFEIVATYAERDAAYEPMRLRMGMADGDAVSFGLPGHGDVLYRFAREGTDVVVTATDVDTIPVSPATITTNPESLKS
jgi:hypothetical protein